MNLCDVCCVAYYNQVYAINPRDGDFKSPGGFGMGVTLDFLLLLIQIH